MDLEERMKKYVFFFYLYTIIVSQNDSWYDKRWMSCRDVVSVLVSLGVRCHGFQPRQLPARCRFASSKGHQSSINCRTIEIH